MHGHRPIRHHREILVRGRTVEGTVGFEVLTPLVLADGTAVLVDRGWVRAGRGRRARAAAGARRARRRGDRASGGCAPAESRGGRRRASTAGWRSAGSRRRRSRPRLPYAVYDAYVSSTSRPAADPAFDRGRRRRSRTSCRTPVTSLQWWLFAVMTSTASATWPAGRPAGSGDQPRPVDGRPSGPRQPTEDLLDESVTATPGQPDAAAWMARTASIVSASAARLVLAVAQDPGEAQRDAAGIAR